MISPRQITFITRKVLKGLGVVEPSVERLVKGTFVARSGLDQLFDDSDEYNIKRGFMLMNDSTAREVIGEYIRFRPEDINNIHKMTGVNVKQLTMEESLWQLQVNIAFMVAVTYMHYSSLYPNVPDDNIDSIALYYGKYFNSGEDATKMAIHFRSKYVETFM